MDQFYDEMTNKSQKPVKRQDKRIQELLKRNSFKNDKEVTKLENELLGVQMDNDDFEVILPQFKKEEKARNIHTQNSMISVEK
jgi:gas vesicle protein